MNGRHKTVLALSLAVAGLALLNGAEILQALGIVLVGGSLAWLIGSHFVLDCATFVWRHRILSAIIAAAGVGALYGWIRYEDHKTEKYQAISDCEIRNSLAPNSSVECDKDPSVTLQPTVSLGNQPPAVSASASEQPTSREILDQIAAENSAARRPARPARRGKAILKRNTCDDLAVYDRDEYAGGNQLVIDQLTTGAAVQVLGHVTVSDEDIIRTPNGQRGFVRPGCLEDVPVTKNSQEKP
jgi:hypothetical protein